MAFTSTEPKSASIEPDESDAFARIAGPGAEVTRLDPVDVSTLYAPYLSQYTSSY
jgi:hypothetical protein